jgi:hypothetical protein
MYTSMGTRCSSVIITPSHFQKSVDGAMVDTSELMTSKHFDICWSVFPFPLLLRSKEGLHQISWSLCSRISIRVCGGFSLTGLWRWVLIVLSIWLHCKLSTLLLWNNPVITYWSVYHSSGAGCRGVQASAWHTLLHNLIYWPISLY